VRRTSGEGSHYLGKPPGGREGEVKRITGELLARIEDT